MDVERSETSDGVTTGTNYSSNKNDNSLHSKVFFSFAVLLESQHIVSFSASYALKYSDEYVHAVFTPLNATDGVDLRACVCLLSSYSFLKNASCQW